MKKLQFDYEMQIDYSIPVSKCNYTIKCIPKDTNRQYVEKTKTELYPESNACYGKDGFRNLQIYGCNTEAHTTFRYRISGTVVTGLADYEEEENPDLDMIFKHPYGLNRPGEALLAYYHKVRPIKSGNDYEDALELMHRLHKDYRYEPFATDVNTSAEEAFVLGKGVCQDYTHIFLALLHLSGIPARYVTGLIVGEGASHAWAEILWQGKWYGLDPTNDVPVCEEHIKIGVGRDAKDCMINRGIMHGGGLHLQTIRVNVYEIGD